METFEKDDREHVDDLGRHVLSVLQIQRGLNEKLRMIAEEGSLAIDCFKAEVNKFGYDFEIFTDKILVMNGKELVQEVRI